MVTWTPKSALPDMDYQEPEVKAERCGTCTYGEATNTGAYIPRFVCMLIEKMFKDMGVDDGNNRVDKRLGICKHYKNWREADAEQPRGAGI